MVLLGLSPVDCMEAAMNGIWFWENQLKRNVSSYLQYQSPPSAVAAEWEKQFDQVVLEKNQQIALLRQECESKSISDITLFALFVTKLK